MASGSGSSGGQIGDGDSRWSRWGTSAFNKSIKISDWASGYANAASAKIGGERFWPKSDDTIEEIAKCERILRAFTVEGIPSKDTHEEEFSDGKGNKIKKKRKVLRKIPPKAIKNAKGIVIYTAMRSGIAPFGGTGGTGLILARLPDGSWSAPASISPNNVSVGLLLGMDVFDVILLLNTEKSLQSFYNHKVTFGAETAIAAGPVGAGASMESGVDRAPIYSYVRSRGLYAGIEAIGQAFLSRFDENERFYYWPGITVQDILGGKVRTPPSVYPLHRALKDAENGVAQGGKLERTVYDVVKVPQSEVMSRLSSHNTPDTGEEEEMLHDGEKLKLPPTPAELEALELAGIPDEEDLRLEQKERLQVYKLPPPPMHHKIRTYWDQHPTKRKYRPTHQLVMIGGPDGLAPEMIPLPPSPWEVPLPPSPVLLAAMGHLRLDEERASSSSSSVTPPPPRRRDGQGATGPHPESIEEEEEGQDAHVVTPPAVILAPPPRRRDGQGAGASAAVGAANGDAPNSDAIANDDPAEHPEPLSPPPQRRDGKGAASAVDPDADSSSRKDDEAVPSTDPLSPPPERKGGQGSSSAPALPRDGEPIPPDSPATGGDKTTLGKELSEAEADALVAEATQVTGTPANGDALVAEATHVTGTTPANGDAIEVSTNGNRDDVAAAATTMPPVSPSSIVNSGILPPPPRRPERKR